MNENEGSKIGFVLVLIGGIISLLGFIQPLGNFVRIFSFGLLNIFSALLYFIDYLELIIFIIIGILAILSAFLMRKDGTLKIGSMMALVIGIISGNIFIILGSIFGIMEIHKNNGRTNGGKSSFGKVMGINMLIVLAYTILISFGSGSFAGGDEGLSFVYFLAAYSFQAFINFFLGGIQIYKGNSRGGVAHIITGIVVIIVGFGACTASLYVVGNI